MARMEAETSNHCRLLMMLLHDQVFDKYRYDSISTRNKSKSTQGQNQSKEKGQTPVLRLSVIEDHVKICITDYA